MAAATVAGGIFNAVAFSLAGWAFSKIDKGKYQEEQKRHDLAIEKMEEDENNWRNQRDQELDRLAKLRDQRYNAIKSEQHTDDELDLYRKANEQFEEQREKVIEKHQQTQPKLKHYYVPSNEFNTILHYTKVGMVTTGMVGAGVAANVIYNAIA